MHRTLAAAAITLLLTFAGCTLAPDYERPATPVPDAWPAATAMSADAAGTAADIPWATFFGDPRLRALITVGLENNRDLRTALLRVEQTRAQYRIEGSSLWPTLDGAADGSRGRTPADLSSSGRAYTASQYRVGGVASWEIDFFGRVRSLKAAALETWLATEEARRAAQLAFISTLATQYLTERSADEQLELGRRTLALVQDSYNLIKHRYDNGVATELDLRTAEAQVASTRATIAEYTRLLAQARNGLAFLVGAPLPDDLPAALPLAGQNLITDLPAGLPADLLQRRPDILQAEHTLRSANANIGAARAAFFPSITLTAFGGTSSADLDGLFKAGSGTWSFAPQITLPIFTGGRNRATLDVAEIQKRIEIAAYEKAIQTAFREVADGLAARSSYDEQLAAQEAQVTAEQSRYDLSDIRYKGGVADYLTVLTAQQDLFAAQQSLIRSRALHLISLVDLYKALGGGWTQEEKPEDQEPKS
ncbi:multidrug transporter [Opitutaceae bacterium TAV5]|nr:multidrug transporter [Opitutaceae bacterium TAV5]